MRSWVGEADRAPFAALRWVVVLAVLAVLAGCRPPPHRFRSSLPADMKPPVTLIGDSTMAAMVWYDAAGSTQSQAILRAGYTVALEAESCRRIAVLSCRGRFGYTPSNAIDVMRANAGRLGEAVVIMAGYDDADLSSAVDAVMAEAELQGVPRVLWLTYPIGVPYVLPNGLPARALYEGHNAALRSAQTRHPTLELLDWNLHVYGHPDWFQRDGIHLTTAGTMELARYLKAELDSRPLGRCLPEWSSGADAPATAAPFTTSQPLDTVTPAAPVTLIDTRPGDGDGEDRMVGSGRWLAVPVGPAVGATAVTARVVVRALTPCRAGIVYVAPCGAPAVTSSPLAGGRDVEVVADLVLTPLQAVCVGVGGQVDITVSLVSWQVPTPPPATTAPSTTAAA